MGQTGRQSPLLVHKSHPKINNSPIIRRVRKSASKLPLLTPNSIMKKSISMDNMPLVNIRVETMDKVLDDCEQYLEDKSQEAISPLVERDCSKQVLSDDVLKQQISQIDQDVITHFNEVVAKRYGDSSPNCSTLPPALSRSKNISRSIVPKMRRMFEKARSADPEYASQFKRLTENEHIYGTSKPSQINQGDGTESTRSSFVMVTPGLIIRSPTGSTTTLSEDSDERMSREDIKNKPGFVNKCVTKVRSFMGKSQERE